MRHGKVKSVRRAPMSSVGRSAAVMGFQDGAANRKSQPHAVRLGRVERLELRPQHETAGPPPCPPLRRRRCRRGRFVRRLSRAAPRRGRRHRPRRIADEIHRGPAGSGLSRRGPGSLPQPRAADRPARRSRGGPISHRATTSRTSPWIDSGRGGRPRSNEVPHAADDPSGAGSPHREAARQCSDLLGGTVGLDVEDSIERLGIVRNRAKRLVDLVGNTGRQLSQARHAGGMGKLLLALAGAGLGLFLLLVLPRAPGRTLASESSRVRSSTRISRASLAREAAVRSRRVAGPRSRMSRRGRASTSPQRPVMRPIADAVTIPARIR